MPVNRMLHLRRRVALLTGRPEAECLRSLIIARYQGPPGPVGAAASHSRPKP